MSKLMKKIVLNMNNTLMKFKLKTVQIWDCFSFRWRKKVARTVTGLVIGTKRWWLNMNRVLENSKKRNRTGIKFWKKSLRSENPSYCSGFHYIPDQQINLRWGRYSGISSFSLKMFTRCWILNFINLFFIFLIYELTKYVHFLLLISWKFQVNQVL